MSIARQNFCESVIETSHENRLSWHITWEIIIFKELTFEWWLTVDCLCLCSYLCSVGFNLWTVFHTEKNSSKACRFFFLMSRDSVWHFPLHSFKTFWKEKIDPLFYFLNILKKKKFEITSSAQPQKWKINIWKTSFEGLGVRQYFGENSSMLLCTHFHHQPKKIPDELCQANPAVQSPFH